MRAFGRARKYFASFWESAEIFYELLEERGNILGAFGRERKSFASLRKSAEIFCELLGERGNILRA
ncbi:MAG: hypothetical protein FD143_3699, partial [Ignavibacteria bacterium]